MPAILLDLMKFGFLLLLYLFVARAVRAIYLELAPARPAPAPRRAAKPTTGRKTRKPPARLHVIESDEIKGKSYKLGDEILIGRADKCTIVLNDTYVSQMHARVYGRDGGFFAEDLGSTNGTYLNGRRITAAAEVHRGDRLKIGKTVMELRR